MSTVTYYLRGPIERPKRGKSGEFVWKDGYSPDSVEGHVTYPWITKREAQVQEKAQGRKVTFEERRQKITVEALDIGPVTDKERMEAAQQEAEDAEERYPEDEV